MNPSHPHPPECFLDMPLLLHDARAHYQFMVNEARNQHERETGRRFLSEAEVAEQNARLDAIRRIALSMGF